MNLLCNKDLWNFLLYGLAYTPPQLVLIRNFPYGGEYEKSNQLAIYTHYPESFHRPPRDRVSGVTPRTRWSSNILASSFPPGQSATWKFSVYGRRTENPKGNGSPRTCSFTRTTVMSFSVTPDGKLTLAEGLSSGESAQIRVRTRVGEASLTVMVRQNSEATVDSQGTLLEPTALDGLIQQRPKPLRGVRSRGSFADIRSHGPPFR